MSGNYCEVPDIVRAAEDSFIAAFRVWIRSGSHTPLSKVVSRKKSAQNVINALHNLLVALGDVSATAEGAFAAGFRFKDLNPEAQNALPVLMDRGDLRGFFSKKILKMLDYCALAWAYEQPGEAVKQLFYASSIKALEAAENVQFKTLSKMCHAQHIYRYSYLWFLRTAGETEPEEWRDFIVYWCTDFQEKVADDTDWVMTKQRIDNALFAIKKCHAPKDFKVILATARKIYEAFCLAHAVSQDPVVLEIEFKSN